MTELIHLAERRRVLIAADPLRQAALLRLFEREPLDCWQPQAADSVAHARFLLQHDPPNALILSGELDEAEGDLGLARLGVHQSVPVLLLAEENPVAYARAWELGVAGVVPFAMVAAHPPLLHAALEQALKSWQEKKANARTQLHLHETRRHVDRLVQMIWRMTPQEDDHWCSERHILDRLFEELARSRRHHVPLSLAVGELRDEEEAGMPDWAADLMLRGKRRCDVIGHYGPNGFLLLMVHTPKAGGVTCCQRLLEALEHPPEALGPPHRSMQAIVGVASTSDETVSPQGLLRHAEENLEAARKAGASVVVADRPASVEPRFAEAERTTSRSQDSERDRDPAYPGSTNRG